MTTAHVETSSLPATASAGGTATTTTTTTSEGTTSLFTTTLVLHDNAPTLEQAKHDAGKGHVRRTHGMPVLGFGTYQLSPEQAYDMVKEALKMGVRHIDTAQLYKNEKAVGDAIRDSGVPRKNIFVTTKLNTRARPEHGDGMRDAVEGVDASLERLGLEYVDLFLLHTPHNTDLRLDRWRGLEKACKEGKAHHLGVSNFGPQALEALLAKCEIRPAVNQIECHAFCFRPKLVEFNRQRDVVVTAYSPLAKSKHMDNPTLQAVAKRVGRTPAQVLVRYCVQRGVAPIPRTSRVERLREDFDVAFELSNDDMAALEKLDAGKIVESWDRDPVEME